MFENHPKKSHFSTLRAKRVLFFGLISKDVKEIIFWRENSNEPYFFMTFQHCEKNVDKEL